MARPAAEIEPQLSIFSSSRILPGPIRPSRSRSIRTLSDGSNVGDDLVGDDLRIFKARSSPTAQPAQDLIPWGIAAFRPRRPVSIAATRVDLNVLPGRIAGKAIALPQIKTGGGGGLCAGNGARRAARNRTHGRANRAARDKAAKDAADHGAADGACGRVGRRGRRRSIGTRRRSVWTRVRIIIDGLDVRDIGRWTIHLLRVEIPDAADVPPIAIAAVMHLVAPASALPGHAAVIGVTAKVSRRQIATRKPPFLRTALRPAHLPGTRRRRTRRLLDGRLALPLPRLRFVLLLRLRRKCKNGHDR